MNSDNSKNQNRFREITIPGDVLDDERLSDGAKLMYGKIARLSYKEGHCWASNSFLDGTKTGRNASRFITELKNSGYIFIKNDRSKYREIRICRVESRINIANSCVVDTSSVDDESGSTSPILAELNSLPRQNGRSNIANSGGVYYAKSGDKTLLDSTNLNSTESTTTPVPQKFIKNPDNDSALPNQNEEKPPDDPKAVAAPFTPEELKNAVLAIDRTLILSADFFPKAIEFMRTHDLDSGYLTWFYKQCEAKSDSSLRGYYYTTFCLENMAEIYKAVHKPAAPPPPENVKCPVCDTVHNKLDEKCPVCSLPEGSNPHLISLFRQLYALPVGRRDEYLKKKNVILSEFKGDFIKLRKMVDSLNQEFNIEVPNETPSRSFHP